MNYRKGPITVTEEFKLDVAILDSLGVFNSFLNLDTRLFIHPDLLKTSRIPELKNSYEKMLKHFSDIMKLLDNSQQEGDRFWREADKRLSFPEFQGLCTGYSSTGTSGSGMGRIFRHKLLMTAKEIIKVGVKDPEIFELVGLFEEGIGCDRISDMVGRIISDDLLRFTCRVFKKLDVKAKPIQFGNASYEIPVNRFNGKPVILLPKDILDDLPEAFSRDDIFKICAKNEELRQRINDIVGSKWLEEGRHFPKAELREFLLRNPDVLRELVRVYKTSKHSPYDFENDPAGEIGWHYAALQFANSYPLRLKLNDKPTIYDLDNVVTAICSKFKELVEDKGLWKSLYNRKNLKPYHESTAQLLFYAIADSYCAASNIDVSPEANAGRGPVDFKFSKGYDLRILVEVKLSTNRQLLHGFNKQLPEYQKAEKSAKSKLLVISFGDPRPIKRLYALKNKIAEKAKNLPEIIVVDGARKKSASKQ